MTVGTVTRPLTVDWNRVVLRVALGVLVCEVVRLGWAFWAFPHAVGVDYQLYMGATAQWLHGGPFYLPGQLAGPYTIDMEVAGVILYPPVALWLFVPFLYLPAVLWWAVPIGLATWSLWHLRPAPWAVAAIAGLMLFPSSWQGLLTGNPAMWILAASSLATLYGWPAVFVLLKPTLAPFALFGIRRRSWWIALGAFALLSLPFGGMWLDWLRVGFNATNGGILYSFGYVPTMLVPLAAYVGRQRAGRAARGGRAAGSPWRAAAERSTLALDRAQLEELARAYGERQITFAEYIAARKPIESRIEAAQRKITRATGTEAIAPYVGQSGALRAAWTDLPLTLQRAIVAAVLDRAIVGPGLRGRTRFDDDRIEALWRV